MAILWCDVFYQNNLDQHVNIKREIFYFQFQVYGENIEET